MERENGRMGLSGKMIGGGIDPSRQSAEEVDLGGVFGEKENAMFDVLNADPTRSLQ